MFFLLYHTARPQKSGADSSSILQFKILTAPWFFYLHLTSSLSKFPCTILSSNGQWRISHLLLLPSISFPKQSCSRRTGVRLCDGKQFTCVSWYQQEAKIRDQTCSPCQDKSSPNGDLMLNPRVMLKNWLTSSCLGNVENICFHRKWSSNPRLGKGERKTGAGKQIATWQ